MRNYLIIAAICAAAVPAAAVAKDSKADKLPPQFERLLGCRAIADPAQRLACFDQQTEAVNKAVEARELVLIDRERVRATKRELFGFSVPSFGGLFGGGEDEVKEISSTVAATRRNQMGGWMIKLADGSTWNQTDDTPVAVAPRRGDKVTVRRGTLGAFYLRLNSQPGVRVQRVG